MAEIKGAGAPNRNTDGAIGDIYTDTETGYRYKCIFAYRTGDNGEFECDWKFIGSKSLEKVKKNSLYGEQQKKEPIKEDNKPVENKPTVTPSPKRRDYSSYSKKNK